MANLPPRPTFINFGDDAPTNNSRRQSLNQRVGTGPRNLPNPRHYHPYHPYDQQPSTPAQGFRVPPWHHHGAQQNHQSSLPRYRNHGQAPNSFASWTGNKNPRPAVNTNPSPPRQQTVYQSGPVMYASRAATNPPSAGASPAHLTSPASTTSTPTAASSGPSLFFGNSGHSGSGWGPTHAATATATGRADQGTTSPSRPVVSGVSRQVRPPGGTGTAAVSPLPPRPGPSHPLGPPPSTRTAAAPPPPPPSRAAEPPSPLSTTPTTPPIPLTPNPNTTLTTTLGPARRTFLTTSAILGNFAAWSSPLSHSNDDDGDNNKVATVDLTVALAPEVLVETGDFEAHLDALQALLRVMHDPKWGEKGRRVMGVDGIWRLGRLKGGLGLGEGWVEWLRGGMGGFVRGLRARGVPGWMDGGWRVEGGGGDTEEALEKAVEVCLVFGWEEEFRAVAGRLAYICRVEEGDGETGERVLVKPDERRVEIGGCGMAAVVAILAGREQVVKQLFAVTQQSLYRWTTGIGRDPCANITCTTNRIPALNVFLFRSGLYPQTKLNKSLQEVIAALQYITATDAELTASAIEDGREDDHIDERLRWAAHIREAYGGTCTECDEKAPTSMLFPLEDLLCDLSFEMQELLEEHTEFPSI